MTAAKAWPRWRSVPAIGAGQIFAWGSSYYLPAVLAQPIAQDTGWNRDWLFGALSVGLVVSGLISPRVGRLVHIHGGRLVLAASALLLAAGLVGIAMAPSLGGFILAWLLIGCGMGAGLYDPAFSTLGRLYGHDAHRAITEVTLFGGFASTVCWPLSAWLNDMLGWRGACLGYAVLHLAVVAPLYLWGLPRETPQAAPVAGRGAPGVIPTGQRGLFFLVAVVFTLAYAVMTIIAVHLLTLMQSRGLPLAAAVGLGTLVGPSQVGGRVLEMLVGRKTHPVWTMLISTGLVAIGTGLLLLAPGWPALAIVLYGMGSGLRSIVRGTVPLALFGREGYALLMGRLAVPTLMATATAPMLGVWLIDGLGPAVTLWILFAVSLANATLVVPLLRHIQA